ISWLHDRKYFTNRPTDYLFLIAAGLVYSVAVLAKLGFLMVLPSIVIVAFLGSVILTTTRNPYWRGILLIAGLTFIVMVPPSMTTIIAGLLLLTILHVFLFTGFFILFGAMKSKSRSGYISFGVFVLLALFLFLFRPMPTGGIADSFVVAHYTRSFGDLNVWLIRVLGLSSAGATASDPFEFSPGAIAV